MIKPSEQSSKSLVDSCGLDGRRGMGCARCSVVASSLDNRQHTMGIGVQAMVRRLPMMVGPLVGGWLITRYGWEQGVRYALLGCMLLSAATAVFRWFIAEPETGPATTTPKPGVNFLGVVKASNPDALGTAGQRHPQKPGIAQEELVYTG